LALAAGERLPRHGPGINLDSTSAALLVGDTPRRPQMGHDPKAGQLDEDGDLIANLI
jgi:hypothetical protein